MINEIIEFKEYTYERIDDLRLKDIKGLAKYKTGLYRPLLIVARHYMYQNKEIDIEKTKEALRVWCGLESNKKYKEIDSFLINYIFA